MTFSKKTTPLHSTQLLKIFFSLLTLSTAFLQRASGPGKNSKYKIFLNKNQYNNLIENGNIKHKLTGSKKNEHSIRRWNWFLNSNGSTFC